VGEVDDVFDSSASHRMNAALAEYRTILASAENGWFADFYPESNYKVGGYSMFFKFDAEGNVDISSERVTNLPMGEVATSAWELIAEQGPVLTFNSYNPVLHYFSEPIPTDVNGQSADYEFVVMKASKDTVELKGKRFSNMLILRRNTENLNPVTYFEEAATLAEDVSSFGMFSFVENDKLVGTSSVVDRTFSVLFSDESKMTIPYAFTPTGIRLAIPVEYNGSTMQNFTWVQAEEKYVCTDPGVNIYFQVYFPDDYQIKYAEFLGKWKMQFHGTSTTTWTEATVEITQKKKNVSFYLYSSELFSFPNGLTLSFDAQKGIISLVTQNAGPYTNSEGVSYDVRVCAYDRAAGYVQAGTGSAYGLVGEWNNDAGGERSITFVDNKVWVTYKANGVLLRLYTGTTNNGNFTANIAGYRFNDITITKIPD